LGAVAWGLYGICMPARPSRLRPDTAGGRPHDDDAASSEPMHVMSCVIGIAANLVTARSRRRCAH
jgi:hypothetical protein